MVNPEENARMQSIDQQLTDLGVVSNIPASNATNQRPAWPEFSSGHGSATAEIEMTMTYELLHSPIYTGQLGENSLKQTLQSAALGASVLRARDQYNARHKDEGK